MKKHDPQRVDWQNRPHFLGVATGQMRRILVDYARKRKVVRRGSERKVQLDDAIAMAAEEPAELIAVHECLERLAEEHGRKAQVVELRFFGGLTEEETAKMLGISVETVKRDWRFSKAWMANHLRRSDGGSSSDPCVGVAVPKRPLVPRRSASLAEPDCVK